MSSSVVCSLCCRRAARIKKTPRARQQAADKRDHYKTQMVFSSAFHRAQDAESGSRDAQGHIVITNADEESGTRIKTQNPPEVFLRRLTVTVTHHASVTVSVPRCNSTVGDACMPCSACSQDDTCCDSEAFCKLLIAVFVLVVFLQFF